MVAQLVAQGRPVLRAWSLQQSCSLGRFDCGLGVGAAATRAYCVLRLGAVSSSSLTLCAECGK